MTHPVFDKDRFPRARADARDFLSQLKQVVNTPTAILALYESSGGDRIQINLQQPPNDIWDDAIQKLAARRLVRALCGLILTDSRLQRLHAPTQALIDAAPPALAPPAAPNDPAQLGRFLARCVGRAIDVRGMTIFVSPYAAYDAYNLDDPRKLGEQLFLRSFEQMVQQYVQAMGAAPGELVKPDFANDILSNMLVATAGSYAISSDYDSVWKWLCDTNVADDDPYGLHEALTGLATVTSDAFAGATSGVEWSGLLLISLDVSSRLERALADADVEFGLLRLLKDGSVSHNRHEGGMRFSKAEILPASCEPKVLQPVMVLKLLGAGYLKEDQQRPMLGLEVLSRSRNLGSLPSLLQLHLQKKPFVMLGGGLIDPFVALCFEALIRPAFEAERDLPSRNGRWVVLHPEANEDSIVRSVEAAIDHLNPDWTAIFDLNRLVHELPDAVSRIGARLAQGANAPAGV